MACGPDRRTVSGWTTTDTGLPITAALSVSFGTPATTGAVVERSSAPRKNRRAVSNGVIVHSLADEGRIKGARGWERGRRAGVAIESTLNASAAAGETPTK